MLRPQLYREALAALSPRPLRNTAAALVLPDYAVRMAILDFEQFPSGDEERIALLRFRLRKSVPFHIEEAQLAYAIQVEEAKQVEVLAVAIARPILDEYESIFRDAGYRLGLVTPSVLATLRLCANPGNELTLVAKTAGPTISVVLVEQERVRLVRSLDVTGGEEELNREEHAVLPLLQQTLAFAEDQIGRSVSRILICGFGPATERLGRLAEREFRIPFEQVRSKFGPASQENAGLLGLLEQYAA